MDFMDQKTRTIILGGVAVLIVAVIIGVFIYLSRNTTGRLPFSDTTSPLSRLETTSSPSVSPVPRTDETPIPANSTKILIGTGFNLNYPASWGVLTCSNSQNFEFDPDNSTDLQNIACNMAIKPITVLVASRLTCQGDKITLSSHQVIKSKTTSDSDMVSYRWCMSTGEKNLDITHRVSASGARASSKVDYSNQIEQMIQTIQEASRGS